MNRIENKNHQIGTYKISQFFCLVFDHNIHILDNGFDTLALGS